MHELLVLAPIVAVHMTVEEELDTEETEVVYLFLDRW